MTALTLLRGPEMPDRGSASPTSDRVFVLSTEMHVTSACEIRNRTGSKHRCHCRSPWSDDVGDSLTRIRTIIVDDETLSRSNVSTLLRRDPEIEIVCECSSGAQALDDIRRSTPDLIF